MTQAEIAAQIVQLESLLNSGATSIDSDGETIHLDQDALRRRLAELRARQSGNRHAQRRVRTLDLSRAF